MLSEERIVLRNGLTENGILLVPSPETRILALLPSPLDGDCVVSGERVVIPAKAGIQFWFYSFKCILDPGLRRDDELRHSLLDG